MRIFVSITFVVFAGLTLFVAIVSLAHIPGAWERYDQEPEDLYVAIPWFFVCGVIGSAWLRAAIRVFAGNSSAGTPVGRVLIGLTVVLGMLMLGSVVLAP